MVLISDGDLEGTWNQLLNLQPPANVALIVTCKENVGYHQQPETAYWLKTTSLVCDIDPEHGLFFSRYFCELDKKFPGQLVSKAVAVFIFSSPLGIGVDDVVFFLKGLIPNENMEQLASLIAHLSTSHSFIGHEIKMLWNLSFENQAPLIFFFFDIRDFTNDEWLHW